MLDLDEFIHLVDLKGALDNLKLTVLRSTVPDNQGYKLDRAIATAIIDQLVTINRMSMDGSFLQRQARAKLLKEDPISMPRYLTEVRADTNSLDKSAYGLDTKVVVLSEEIVRVFKSTLSISHLNMFKRRNNKRGFKVSESMHVNTIYNAFMSLGKGADAKDRHKLHAAIIAIDEVLRELTPLVDNLEANKQSLVNLEDKIVSLTNRAIDLNKERENIINVLDQCNKSIDRINRLSQDSSIHPSKNNMTTRFLQKREAQRTKATQDLQSLVSAQNDLGTEMTTLRGAKMTLESSIKQEKSVIKDGLVELSQCMKDYIGLTLKHRLLYLIKQSSW